MNEKLVVLLLAVAAVLILHFFPQIRDRLSPYISFYESDRVVTAADGDLAVHFIDVGQGDSALIITPEQKIMLIDAGTFESKDYLTEYLKACKITSIDYFVLTHPHADHIGGAAQIFDEFEVTNVILPDAVTDTSTYKKVLRKIEAEDCGVITPEPKKEYSLGNARFTILGPVDTYPDVLNNMSVVIRLDYGSTSFLFTGDAETQSETDMLDYFPASYFQADVLKLGHHGSSTSTSDEWLAAVRPKYAVVSCGKNNDYGHPHREIVSKLQTSGITWFRTDESGSIVMSSDGKKITILSPDPT